LFAPEILVNFYFSLVKFFSFSLFPSLVVGLRGENVVEEIRGDAGEQGW